MVYVTQLYRFTTYQDARRVRLVVFETHILRSVSPVKRNFVIIEGSRYPQSVQNTPFYHIRTLKEVPGVEQKSAIFARNSFYYKYNI